MKNMPQLNSLRALSILLVSFHHWSPKAIHLPIPYAFGVFLFFVLSGYLITHVLLKGRDLVERGEASLFGYIQSFLARRVLRIFPAFLVAMGVYLIFGYADVREHWAWFLGQTSNFLFASTGKWSPGASQFWTLAIEQQFYLAWPVVIFGVPRRHLLWVLVVLSLVSPAFRLLESLGVIEAWAMSGKPTWKCLDYLAVGAICAVLQRQGVDLLAKKWGYAYQICAVIYVMLWWQWFIESEVPYVQWIQQSCLAVACAGMVMFAGRGFGGVWGRLLDDSRLQRVGVLSYGLYLYHNLSALLMGHVTWFFWEPEWAMPLFPLRIVVLGCVTFWLAKWSWEYVESPVYKLKGRFSYKR